MTKNNEKQEKTTENSKNQTLKATEKFILQVYVSISLHITSLSKGVRKVPNCLCGWDRPVGGFCNALFF